MVGSSSATTTARPSRSAESTCGSHRVRLALSWRQAGFEEDQSTDVEVRFDDVGTNERPETRVTVEHTGWDGIPQASVARHGMELHVIQLRLAEWWQAQLRSLGEGR